MSASIQGGAAAATEGVDVAAARRPGSIRHVALREPTAIAGLAIITFFVLVADILAHPRHRRPEGEGRAVLGRRAPPTHSASTAAARTWSNS